jgi:hypothetical protein
MEPGESYIYPIYPTSFRADDTPFTLRKPTTSPHTPTNKNCQINSVVEEISLSARGFCSIGVFQNLKMMAQFRDWIHGLNLGDRLMIFPFIVIYQEMRILAKNHHNASQGLVCGMVFGSSAALPFLWPLKLTLLYLLYSSIFFPILEAGLTVPSDFGIFVCAAILFTVMNRADIAL